MIRVIRAIQPQTANRLIKVTASPAPKIAAKIHLRHRQQGTHRLDEDRLSYWRRELPARHVLHVLATSKPLKDGYQLNPAGATNLKQFAGSGPAMSLHGRTAIGALPIGTCVDCWPQDGKLLAVTKIHAGPPPRYWSVGWLPVGENPPSGYIDRWWLFEYSSTTSPVDPEAKTLQTGKWI